jgi:hypothetical protein
MPLRSPVSTVGSPGWLADVLEVMNIDRKLKVIQSNHINDDGELRGHKVPNITGITYVIGNLNIKGHRHDFLLNTHHDLITSILPSSRIGGHFQIGED